MRAFLSQHWFLIVLALGVGVALGFPRAVHQATDFWEPRRTVAVSLFLIAWTMPTRSLLAELRHPIPALWAILLSYGFVPIASWLLGFLTSDADVRIGLILVSSVPCTLSSAVLWTRLAGGNEATALLAVTGTTLLSWATTTAWLSWLTGTVVELDVGEMMLDLSLYLIVPTVLGQAFRRFPSCADFAERHKFALGTVSQCFVLAIILKAGVTVGDKLHEDPGYEAVRIFLWSIGLTLILHGVSLLSGLYSARGLGMDRGRQIAVAFASSQKTLQVSLVLYEQYFKIAFPFAVMPMLFYHVIQLLMGMMIAHRLGSRPAKGNEDERSPLHNPNVNCYSDTESAAPDSRNIL